MNKKILIISMALLAIAMLVAPVMAKPSNAVDKNPNVVLDTTTLRPGGVPVVDLNLPSEVTNRWFGSEAHIVVKPADKFYNPTEIQLDQTNFWMWFSPEYRGKWVKMSQMGYLALFTFFGLTPPTDVPPEGVYIWGSRTS
ncbi:MAG: hypothetical protein ACFFCW_41730 [Candidatus Hodarchaeota archaeon]